MKDTPRVKSNVLLIVGVLLVVWLLAGHVDVTVNGRHVEGPAKLVFGSIGAVGGLVAGLFGLVISVVALIGSGVVVLAVLAVVVLILAIFVLPFLFPVAVPAAVVIFALLLSRRSPVPPPVPRLR